jgi:CheY-like chemotaxis protein
MLQVDEVTSDWSVLLAMTDKETVRLLSVILDGFGYTPLECSNRDDVYGHLSSTTPSVAVVDVQMSDSEEICSMIHERGGISLVVLLADGEDNPQDQLTRFQADAWESVIAGPEKLLLILRKLASREVQAS